PLSPRGPSWPSCLVPPPPRHAWTSGEFVKNLLYFGLDIHIVELRGHGKSSQQLQRERSELTGRPLPPDFDYGWDADDYLLHDLPAAVAGVHPEDRRPPPPSP